jgi:hypothetical protein
MASIEPLAERAVAPADASSDAADAVGRGVDRRTLLKVGGFSVAAAALIAACGGENGSGNVPKDDNIPLSGTAPPIKQPGDGVYDDAVLLRTATSLQYNALEVIAAIQKVSGIDPDVAALSKDYAPLVQRQADELGRATTEIGGTPYEAPNPRFNEEVVAPSLHLISVSQTPASDAANFMHAVIAVLAETMQSFVPLIRRQQPRQLLMQVGTVHGREAGWLANAITPQNIVSEETIAAASPSDPVETTTTTPAAGLPTTTEAPTTSAAGGGGGTTADIPVYVVPATFGQLGAVQVVLGNANDQGADKRTVINIETPSLNSFVYNDQKPE